MALQEKLEMLLTLDADGAVRGFKKVGQTADRELSKTQNRIDAVGTGMRKAGAAMLAMGGVAAVGLARAAGKASDLAESVNVTELVFKDASDAIDDFVSNSAQGLGMSERAARDATATFGGLLDNLGFAQSETVAWSQDLTTLAADLASAFNTTPEDAVTALGSAMRGESEPIRRFNVMLDDATVRQRAVEMGLAATTAEVDNQGKAAARLNMIIEQTDVVAGDFANTSDGLANRQRILSAEWENLQAALGEGVLPVMETATGLVTGLVGGFSDLNTKSSGLVSKIAGIGTGLLLVGGAASMVIGQVIKMRDNFGRAATKMKTMGGAARGVAVGLGAVGATVGAIFLVKEGLDAMGWSAKKLKLDMDELAGASSDALVDAFLEFSGAMEDLGQSGRGLEVFRDIAEGSFGTAQRLRDALEEAGEYSSEYDRILGEVATSHAQAESDTDGAAAAIDEHADAVDGATDATGDLVEETGDLSDEFETLNDLITDTVELLDSMPGGARDYERAVLDTVQAAEDLANTVDDPSTAVDERRLAELDLLDAIEREAEAYAEQEGLKARGAGLTWDEVAANDAKKAALGRLSKEYGEVRDEVGLYLDTLALIPDVVNTRLTVDIELDPAAIKQLEYWLSVGRTLQGPFGMTFPGAPEIIGPFSSGGPVPGPNGQPQPVMAHGGEFILSADVVDAIKSGSATRGILAEGGALGGGGGVTQNFLGYTSDDLVRNVDEANAQSAWTNLAGRADG